MEQNANNLSVNRLNIKKKAYFFLIISIISVGLILFLSAGTLMYWQAWIYCGLLFGLMIFIMFFFLSKDPEFIRRRMKHREKEVQQRIIIRIGSFVFMIGFLIPGIDYRYQWSSVPVTLVIISDIIVFLGYLLVFFVFKENSYASRVVEVEQEQKVITTGPYAIVRHPMYSGVLLMYLFTPLALGSFWALIPFAALIPIFVLRALNEEKVLLRELPEYKEYYLKTRYRLIPLVW